MSEIDPGLLKSRLKAAPSSGHKQPIISLRGIRRSFEIGGEHSNVLVDVNLDIYPGQFIVIRGDSGTGKSTLLRILGLLDHDFSGSYSFAGVNVEGRPDWWLDEVRSDNIGFVFQEGRLFDHLSLQDNILVSQRLRREKDEFRGHIDRFSQHYFESWEIDRGLLQDPAVSASGGQRQRAAIWRALSTRPPILLADEPTASLDAQRKGKIKDLLVSACSIGVTVIVVSHDDLFYDLGEQYEMLAGKLVPVSDASGAPSPTPLPRDLEGELTPTANVTPSSMHQGVDGAEIEISNAQVTSARAPKINPAPQQQGQAGTLPAEAPVDLEPAARTSQSSPIRTGQSGHHALAPRAPSMTHQWSKTLGGWSPRADLLTLFRQVLRETFGRPIFLLVVLVALIAGTAQITFFLSLLFGTQDFIDYSIKQGSRLNRVQIKPKTENRAKPDRFPDRHEIAALPDIESVVGRRESTLRLVTGPDDTTPYVAMGLHDDDPEYKLLYFLAGQGFSSGAQDLEIIVTQALSVDLEITPPLTASEKQDFRNYIGRQVEVQIPTFSKNGRERERKSVKLKIAGVISKAEGGRQAYLPNRTLVAFDRYKRDRLGEAPLPVTGDGTAWSLPAAGIQSYADFPWEDRLHIYTKEVRGVIAVFSQIAQSGYRPQSDIWEYKWVLDIQDIAWNVFMPLMGLIVVVVVLTVGTNIYYSAQIRKKEFALWRILGMRVGDLALTQVASTIIMVVLGTVVGVGLGMLLIEPARTLLQSQQENEALGKIFAPVLAFSPLILIGAIVIGILSAIFPARQAGRTNPAKILQSN